MLHDSGALIVICSALIVICSADDGEVEKEMREWFEVFPFTFHESWLGYDRLRPCSSKKSGNGETTKKLFSGPPLLRILLVQSLSFGQYRQSFVRVESTLPRTMYSFRIGQRQQLGH